MSVKPLWKEFRSGAQKVSFIIIIIITDLFRYFFFFFSFVLAYHTGFLSPQFHWPLCDRTGSAARPAVDSQSEFCSVRWAKSPACRLHRQGSPRSTSRRLALQPQL